jgi:hypothetical protein
LLLLAGDAGCLATVGSTVFHHATWLSTSDVLFRLLWLSDVTTGELSPGLLLPCVLWSVQKPSLSRLAVDAR